MAEVTLYVAGRPHTVVCRDGEEPQLEALGRRLDAHAATASRAAGAQGGERTMLFIALMLADALGEAERRPGSGDTGGGASDAALARIADRLESLADSLEKDRDSA